MKNTHSRRRILQSAAALGAAAAFPMPAIAQGARRKIRISTLPAIILFPTYAARDLKVFEEFGIDAEFVVARGGSEVTQLMVSGAADIANAGVEHVYKLRETGLDVRVLVVQENRYLTELVVHKAHEGKITKIADLKGKSIGVSGIGSGTHVSARYLLKAAGLDPETDVTFVAVGAPTTMVKAMEQRQIDALMSFDPAQAILKEQLKIVYPLWSGVAGNPPALFQDFAMECFAAKTAFIDKNQELCADLVRATVKTLTLIREADPRVMDSYAKMFPGVDAAVLRASLNQHLPAFTPILTRQGVQNVNEYSRFAGVTTRDITYDEIVAKQFEPLWQDWKAPAPKLF